MTVTRMGVPSQIGTALVALTVLSGLTWLYFVAGEPDSASRETAAEQLGQHEGIELPLPVRLPAGYEPPDEYSTSVNADGIAYARSTRFHPTGEDAPDGSPVVAFCAQGVYAADRPCEPPPEMQHMQRAVGPIQVVIWVEYPKTANLDQWKSIDLTTDLHEVTWLH